MTAKFCTQTRDDRVQDMIVLGFMSIGVIVTKIMKIILKIRILLLQ